MCVCVSPTQINKNASKTGYKSCLGCFFFALLAINTTDMAKDALQGDFPCTLHPLWPHCAATVHLRCHTVAAATCGTYTLQPLGLFRFRFGCCSCALPFPLPLPLFLCFLLLFSFCLPLSFCSLSASLFNCSITCGLLLLSSFMAATD